MNLQQKTIRRYRQHFPQDSLRDISAKTGINFTRVFRIFNHQPMKLSEFEVFNQMIQNKEAQSSKKRSLMIKMEDLMPLMSDYELQFFIQIVERKIFNNKIKLNEFTTHSSITA
jgi:hypothetical protein